MKAHQVLRRNPDQLAPQWTRYGGSSWVCVGLKWLVIPHTCFWGQQTRKSHITSVLLSPTVCFSLQGNESIVAKTTVMVPSDGGPIEAISTIQTVPYGLSSRRKSGGYCVSVCPSPEATTLSQNVTLTSLQDPAAACAFQRPCFEAKVAQRVIPFGQRSSCSLLQVLCSLGAASRAWAASRWSPKRRLMALAPRRTTGE